ncbi:gamma-glutamyl-gamma-aminobutyrate hydrolase family protein [Sphingomonas sp. YL-JM2C]
MTLPLIALTQRVDIVLHANGPGERRDALDQAWMRFLAAAGLRGVPIPNHVGTALALFNALPIAGLVLTGGNDLTAYGGDAPERDATESALLGVARARRLPVIGVCRGMQMLQHACGARLEAVQGHVVDQQPLRTATGQRIVNSYHRMGSRENARGLTPWAWSADGIIKAIRHETEQIVGIMWHPERLAPFAIEDLELFRSTLVSRRELAA